jgi:type I restriction enzyme S subunit
VTVRPYPNYRDSGIAWLGQVPADWSLKPLKRALRLITARASDRSFPVVLENLEGWTGRFLSTEATYEGEGVAFEKGDLLFGKLRPYLAKVWAADRIGQAVGDIHVLAVCRSGLANFCIAEKFRWFVRRWWGPYDI